MALNIENQDVENLLEKVTQITGESKMEAVQKALEERHQRLLQPRAALKNEARLFTFLREELWPQIPPELSGTQLSKAEEEEILGYREPNPVLAD